MTSRGRGSTSRACWFLGLLGDGGHALAEHGRDLVAGADLRLVQQADHQRQPPGRPHLAQVGDVGNVRLASELGDLWRRDARQPRPRRPQPVEPGQVGQVLLELGEGGGLGGLLEPVVGAARLPGRRLERFADPSRPA